VSINTMKAGLVGTDAHLDVLARAATALTLIEPNAQAGPWVQL